MAAADVAHARADRYAEEAAVLARSISRQLKAAGFQMSKRIGRTYGFRVFRVGCGSFVSIASRSLPREEDDKVRAFLEGRGYVLAPGNLGMWIDARNPRRNLADRGGLEE